MYWLPKATSEPPPPPPSQRMTDRDTFASAALTGLLADDGDRIDQATTDFTRRAYEWADAMLLERGVVVCEPTKPTLTNDERAAIAYGVAALQSAGNYEIFAKDNQNICVTYLL